MMALANRNPIAAGPQSNVHQRKNAVVRRLKAKIIGDASTFESACERSTMLNRSAISLGLLGSALYQPNCASCSILILVADQKYLLVVHQ
jgi:hypothetical protein